MEDDRMVVINEKKTRELLDNLDEKHSNLESLNDVLSIIIDKNDNNKTPLFYRKQLIALITSFNIMIKGILEETQKLWDCVIFESMPLE